MMAEHPVVIAGAGPTGLMLAAELAVEGVDVAIVERRANQDLDGSRGSGLHARTIEIMDQRGIADRFISQGKTHPAVMFHIPLDITDFPTRHNYVLAIWQKQIERIMADWVGELAVTIYREREVTGCTQDDGGVDIALSDGQSIRAQYLVGCDGGRSIVRKAAGIEFPGWDATISWLIAEVQTAEEPKLGFHVDARGRHAIGKGDNGTARVVMIEREPTHDREPTLQDVRENFIEVYGTDFGLQSANWVSRFTDMTRQAATYRDKRVFLAGDAAHVHPPLGGQGLNIGVQDAVNLGWKLAQVVKRTSPDALLDTYHAERHPVAAHVLRNTMAQVAFGRTDDRSKALNDMVAEFLRMNGPRRRMVAEISGLGVHYELGATEGATHPLLGRRMPDLDLITPDGPIRVFNLLRDARAVLINFVERAGGRTDERDSERTSVRDAVGFDTARWSDRVRSIEASYDGAWELPEIGVVTAPAAVLVRPDGYVAWVSEGSAAGLVDALTKWFGAR